MHNLNGGNYMSVNNSSPDLTQHAPRSPRLRLGGYALLPRIIAKRSIPAKPFSARMSRAWHCNVLGTHADGPGRARTVTDGTDGPIGFSSQEIFFASMALGLHVEL